MKNSDGVLMLCGR